MTHDLFGKLKYKDADESWAGSALLPRFAATGLRPEPPEMTEEEARQAIEDILLLTTASEMAEWDGVVLYLPL